MPLSSPDTSASSISIESTRSAPETDAFTMPEIFWLAARWGRWGLGRVLDSFIADQFLTADEAWSAAEAILGGTARRLYGV